MADIHLLIRLAIGIGQQLSGEGIQAHMQGLLIICGDTDEIGRRIRINQCGRTVFHRVDTRVQRIECQLFDIRNGEIIHCAVTRIDIHSFSREIDFAQITHDKGGAGTAILHDRHLCLSQRKTDHPHE